jgi:hypothetical protein
LKRDGKPGFFLLDEDRPETKGSVCKQMIAKFRSPVYIIPMPVGNPYSAGKKKPFHAYRKTRGQVPSSTRRLDIDWNESIG